ncbi:serine-threonine rich [Favolaschia claudopus]|uniref:Serine-threonine rich n=1 Tax=Favolaschia claudopus TaxID=2862362 RepID=A0AAW0D7S9_9AGAR
MHFLALASLALAPFVAAADITVKVGEAGGLTYNPNNVTAAAGDKIIFQFLAKNHSTFGNPCALMTTPVAGIDSGYQFVAANATMVPEWSFTVMNASSPLWFFCAQTGHCGKGMVFSVNAPSVGNTFEAFQAAAMATSGQAPPTNPPNSALLTRASGTGMVAVAFGVLAGLLL